MSGGRASRDKGNRAERTIVKFLKDRGFNAERVPLSGAAGGSYLGDLTVSIANLSRVVEVKARATGFRELYRWLVDRDMLIVMADRSEPLVVLPLGLAADIFGKAGGT
jgi:Holliday junction resolvase